MNILFLTQVLPYPLDAGPKIRAYYVLRHLAETGHRVVLASFVREDDRPEYLAHLRRYCSEVHALRMPRSRTRDALVLAYSLISRRSFLLARDWAPSMARLLERIAAGSPLFDAVHADQLWMAPYALFARRLAPAGRRPMTVLDQHNAVFKIPARLAWAETRRWKRVLLDIEAKNLARHERALCRQFDTVVWVAGEDRQAMDVQLEDSAARNGSQFVIPIGLDLSTRTLPCKRDGRHRVTFMGGLHWPPNAEGVHWFCREIWPEIRSRLPGAVLTIIGRDSRKMLGAAMRDPSIEAMGYVADPVPYLAETGVFIVPLRAGGGLRVKILDAWSWELPVVSTGIGAEGLRVRHGENLCLADEPASFASAVVEIMNNPSLAAHLAREGRRTLEQYYDWRKAYRAWDRIYPCESCTSSLTPPI